jgi:RNA methyltransferase, TrmH family
MYDDSRRPRLTLPRTAKAEASPAPHMSAPPAKQRRRKPFCIAGWAAVEALFACNPQRAHKLYFDERFLRQAGPLCAIMASMKRPYRLTPKAEMEKIAGSPLHGGIIVDADPKPVLPFSATALAPAHGKARTSPLLFLDGISNPHNLGAIVRTAAFFGLDRIILSDHKAQAMPSEAAYRVAEGGFEHLELFRLEGGAAALATLGDACCIIGTGFQATPLPRSPHALVLPVSLRDRPFVLALGNEEVGLSAATLETCHACITIPGAGRVQSLNVSASAAILIHWALHAA